MNNKLIKQAESLTDYSIEYLTLRMEEFERLYNKYTSQKDQDIQAGVCFKMMTLYLLAMSMKELDWPSDWKTRGESNYPATPDYAN